MAILSKFRWNSVVGMCRFDEDRRTDNIVDRIRAQHVCCTTTMNFECAAAQNLLLLYMMLQLQTMAAHSE